MQRSRIEALLASFPKLADSGTQHTTVEQDNVRFVYQPLDELYMVLITNRQSNILQDIDSLHLFAQVVTSTCRTLDEREILKNAYELLSAFDEIVTLGYRENERQSSWKCSAKKLPGVEEVPCLGHQSIPPILPPPAALLQIHMIHMRQRRISRTSMLRCTVSRSSY
jgi:hypothetical protein